MIDNNISPKFSPEFPNQRVSRKQKETFTWTKQMAKYVISLAMSVNDKSETQTLLNMANGIVDRKMYEYVFKTFGIKKEDKDSETLIQDLREVDILQPIKDKYLGEFTSSYNNYQVYSNDPDTVIARNAAFGKKVLANMQQLLINELNARGVNTNEPSKEVTDVSAMLKEHIKSWDMERVAEAQNRLNLLNNEIDAKLKYNQLYYYWWACEEAYTHRSVNKGRVEFEIVPPQEYFRVPSGNTFVEDDDYGLRIGYMSIYDILDRYSDKLTENDITYIRRLTNTTIDAPTRVEFLKSRLVQHGMSESDISKCIEPIVSNTRHSMFYNIDKIPFAHYVFKTETKVGYLKYVNEIGEVQETVVDEDYELDYEGGDVSITWDWIHQIFEGEIFGYNVSSFENFEAVYTKVRPVDIQREHFSNMNKCKLPYNGISYIVKDSDRKPIPYRINPYLALIRILYYQIERAINKWKSFIAIPQSILNDGEDMKLEERMSKLQGEGLLIFNDEEVNANLLQAIKEVATTATYNYINTLSQFINNIKAEANEVANMTPSRRGDQAAYQGKSVTEYSILQSNISNNWSLEMFNIFRAVDYLANYDHSKIAWVDGHQGSYVDESTGESNFVAIDGAEHFSMNIGITVGNSKILDEKLKAMKEVAFAASQNGEFDLAAEGIMNDNLQSLRGKVAEFTAKKREYEAQMEAARNQSVERIKQMEIEATKADNAVKLQVEEIKAQSAMEVAIIKQETELLVWDKRLQMDTDGNGYISNDEQGGTSLVDEANQRRTELEFKRQDMNIKRESLALRKQSQSNKAK